MIASLLGALSETKLVPAAQEQLTDGEALFRIDLFSLTANNVTYGAFGDFLTRKLGQTAVVENKARAGSVVVLDAQTGEVLALANYPSYDPGNRQNLTGAQLRNRALTDTFEPGSTMKPFIAALALEKGLVKPATQIQTAPGRMTIGGSTISDSHAHGPLTVSQIIQKSSNIGTVKIAMQMQPRDMWEMFSQIGLGQKPQLAFPGAVSGKLRAYKTWRPIEQATMSYGYGLSVSLFQLARAYTVFARDGDLAPVTLLKSGDAAAGVRVIDAKTAQAMRQMLHLVTLSGGTAPKAQIPGKAPATPTNGLSDGTEPSVLKMRNVKSASGFVGGSISRS